MRLFTNARWSVGLGLLALTATLSGCGEDFDPPTLVNELRIFGISAEPPDLAEGEATLLTALIASPDDSDVTFSWDWCPYNSGPDAAYECNMDGFEVPDELLDFLFLGNTPSVVLFYPGDAEYFQQACFDMLASVEFLPDFVQLPNCEQGLEIIVRLTVATGTLEKIGIKRVFLWFEDPAFELRNRNPEITGIDVGGVQIEPNDVLITSPGGGVSFRVMVDESSMETFVVRDDPSDETTSREDIIFSFFSTAGDWDLRWSYADLDNFSLAEAGRNRLNVPREHQPNTVINTYFVIRDGRGGTAWTMRQVSVTE